jgi:histidyl-tRNA synthetase
MLTSVSGYPEWLPENRLVEKSFINLVQSKFELFGFTPIETRAIEPISTLLKKGETDKEIYLLRRLQAAEDEPDQDIGLHFDLTVPFARYVLENKNRLIFPLRRYQIQKAWRGERPGLGRFREFLQADMDIVAEGNLSIYYDLEIIETINDILISLPIPEIRIFINNRKILEGAYQAIGITSIAEALRIVDKLAKIGEKQVHASLMETIGLTSEVAGKCLELGKITTQDPKKLEKNLHSLGIKHELVDEGLYELNYILNACSKQKKNSVFADLSIVRGLDYYTGTICEAKFLQFPKYPTIAAGGRYDNLVADKKKQLPGVGVSLGITRILGLVLHEGILSASRKTPTCVLVALISDETREKSLEAANALRKRGIPCEIYPRPLKFGKQIKYADRLGIPYVWFPSETDKEADEVRDLRSKTQVTANANSWTPPSNDLTVQIQSNNEILEKVMKKSAYH